jgi:hypothetical protein
MAGLYTHLTRDVKACISRHSASSYRNFQVVLHLKNATAEESYQWVRDANASLKAAGVQVAGKDLYITLEQPEWKRQRNRALRQALAAVESLCDGPYKLDFSTGSLWHSGRDLQWGYWHRMSGAWRWVSEGLTALGLDRGRVEQALAEEQE